MDLETAYRQARRQLDELHKEYRFAEDSPEFVPKGIRDERMRLSILVREMAAMRWERIPASDRMKLRDRIERAIVKANVLRKRRWPAPPFTK